MQQLIFLTAHVEDCSLKGEAKAVRELRDFLDKEFDKQTVEKEQFNYFGCEIERAKDGQARVSQKLYAENVKTIPLTRARRQVDNLEVTEKGYELLRLGAISLAWMARMSRIDQSLTVSQLQSASGHAQVRYLKDHNTAVKELKDYEQDG
eukprot:16333653-Heterocapsa_arctica.AAC.1